MQLLALYLCLQLRLALVGRSSPRHRQAFQGQACSHCDSSESWCGGVA
jgi:hypothetical protein